MNKVYLYTLFTNDGDKIRGEISASSDEIAKHTLEGIVLSRSEVKFGTIDSLDFPADYDWDSELQEWQSRIF